MKRKRLIMIVSLFLFFVISCEGPETVVTNIVHPDGSVTRRVEMRNDEEKFNSDEFRVPLDSTWTFRDTIEIDTVKGDTTWIRHAEKLFKSVDEINNDYLTDKGVNRSIKREARFIRKFRWFNTEFRFSENIDKGMIYGYPVKDFLTNEEIEFFYLPDYIVAGRIEGPDSLHYLALSDSVRAKTERWLWYSMISEWTEEFLLLTAKRSDNDFNGELLRSRGKELAKQVFYNSEKSDSATISDLLGGTGMYIKYKTEIDSATSVTDRRYEERASIKNYSVKIVMPGKLVGTNGFLDKNGELLWPVKSDFFLTEPYEMWADSKITNTWAWIISGLFLLFVISGLLIRIFRKK